MRSSTNGQRNCGTAAAPAPCYTTFTQQFGNPIKSLRTSDINFYVQDTWKVSKKVTFSYGLRYEKAWLPQPTINAKTDIPVMPVRNIMYRTV